jgi:hypothetical protein
VDVSGHCSGPWITIDLMKVSSSFIAGGLTYDVPPVFRLPRLERSLCSCYACFMAARSRILGLVPEISNTANGLMGAFLLTLNSQIQYHRSTHEGGF